MADMLVRGIKISKPGEEKSESVTNETVNPNRYGRTTEVEKTEFFDDEKTFASKLDQLCQWIKESQHCIMFTGAGISTSTGIPDFRSGMDTVLKTGPGVWELRDRNVSRPVISKCKEVLKAVPSPTHMGIVALNKYGSLKFVVSQNVDGLHLRSGLDPNALAELHGNTNLETCVKCKQKYLRDFRTRNASKVRDHETGRFCTDAKCRGKLVDSIVNFGESLPMYDLNRAYENAELADLCICMGSSLTVSPANEIPDIVASRNQRLVICNLQRTPLHGKANLAIHAMCDDIMINLLKRLQIPLEKWKLRRRIRIIYYPAANGIDFKIIGLDLNRDLPYSLFTRVVLSAKFLKSPLSLTREPFTTVLPFTSAGYTLRLDMTFHGHYSEPNASYSLKIRKDRVTKDCILVYDLQEGKWEAEDV